MRNVTINISDEKDLEFVQKLQNLGMKRTVACVIIFLKDQNERSSRDIEVATGLNQPEVSIAMRTLRQNNWVNEREIKAKRKGRSTIIYKLSVPIVEIIQHYEEVKNSETAKTMQAIQRLKELSSAN
ncbi:MAG: ArsR family transcriptional regulator [Methanothrix sp.]|nr:MAG: ArsR family transcriptional regulator [Methanothrix sp.]